LPLPLPNLDDRRWADLVEEGVALLPRYAPAWTDHNIHDPGITIIELFAWLTEQSIYRANRISDRHRRKFLALIGFSPRPPQPANAILGVTLAAGAGPLDVPVGCVFLASAPAMGALPFTTIAPVTLLEANLVSAQVHDGTRFSDRTRALVDHAPILAFGSSPRPAGADDGPGLYLGFDQAWPANVEATLHFNIAGTDGSERARLLAELEAIAAECKPPSPCSPCPPHPASWCIDSVDPTDGSGSSTTTTSAALLLHHSVRLVWEYFGATGWQRLEAVAGEVIDDTRSLTLDGTVRFRLPNPMVASAIGAVPDSRFWIRSRIDRGDYDAAPMLSTITFNAVQLVQTLLVTEHQVTTGNDLPEQHVLLEPSPIAFGRVDLHTVEPTGNRPWRLRIDLDASGPRDADAMLDATRGELFFGDGERGRVPPADASLMASWSFTDAARGNLPADGKWEFAADKTTPLSIAATALNAALLGVDPALFAASFATLSNLDAATGGADAETIGEAAARAAEFLWAHERLVELCPAEICDTLDQLDPMEVRDRPAPARAVTALDYERIAVDVPGTRVRRARAWPGIDARYPCLAAPGTVTVIIVPALPAGRPQPSRGLIRAVRSYLERRRTICTRLIVLGPTYRIVAVRATVRMREGAEPARVGQDVVQALRTFLDPLEGGSAGLGWPFGRDVYRSEILHVIDSVDGVDHVIGCELSADAGEPQCGNICIPANMLAASGDHRIQVVEP
jgi:predicted phage baseplate assembly protein